ncbi:MAG: PrsW family intramembrane metalloprotease [Treponema sp.]|nr:PrsW family intramembrane metalloprotease [Treponema sp.]
MLFQIILPIIVCFIPVVICFFIFKQFQIKALSLLAAVLLGLIAILPISFLQFWIPDPKTVVFNPVIYSMLKSLIIFGLVEEAFKALLIWPLPGKKEETPLKYLIISFMFGISLGCFESVVYYLDKLQMSLSRGGSLLYAQIFLRLISSDIIHMTCAGLSGLFVYTAVNKKPRYSFFIYAFVIHGLYDFFSAFQNNLKWFAIPVVLLAIMECRIKYTVLVPSEEE